MSLASSRMQCFPCHPVGDMKATVAQKVELQEKACILREVQKVKGLNPN